MKKSQPLHIRVPLPVFNELQKIAKKNEWTLTQTFLKYLAMGMGIKKK